jgi:hypothetical protein
VLLALAACSQPVPVTPTQVVATIQSVATSAATLEPRFDPTAAVGGGVNASGAIAAEQLRTVFGAVQQSAQMRFTANASPPGATGSAIKSISITAEDAGGVVKTLDATSRRALGEALLTAAGTAWPQASITLLVTDPSSSSQLIGSRPPGGPNIVIAS